MAEDKDDSQKTEEPTQKRLDDAIKQGNVAFSREVNAFFSLLIATIVVFWVSGSASTSLVKNLSIYINNFSLFIDRYGDLDVMYLVRHALLTLMMFIGALFGICFLSAFLGSFLQNGIIYSSEALDPKLERISPISGFKRIFSKRALVDFLKGLAKISMLGLICYLVLKAELGKAIFSINGEASHIFPIFHNLLGKALVAVCIFMAFFAVIDLLYTRFEYINNLKMTRQEVKEELKQSEGNPEIKAKQRSIRQMRAKRQILAAVKEADVLVTNPTHFSVALKYEKGKMPAPIVTAKGADHMALQMRKIARANKVPIMENKPLARSLYDNVEINEYIPYEHYRAVAEIISKVMKG